MSGSSQNRSVRVGQLLQEELGRLLVEGVKDPRVGFVTVTEVRVTPDLRTARVYVSVLDSPERRAATLEGLTAASGYLRRTLGHALRLRFTPQLVFCLDDTLDRAERLDAVMRAIAGTAPQDLESEGTTPENVSAEGPHWGQAQVTTDRTALAHRRDMFEQLREGGADASLERVVHASLPIPDSPVARALARGRASDGRREGGRTRSSKRKGPAGGKGGGKGAGGARSSRGDARGGRGGQRS